LLLALYTMRYKFSNIAQKNTLENFAGVPLKFPKIYQPSPVITGDEETIVPIITQENPTCIDFGIWGLLPKDYDEDWQTFQNVIDTLTVVHEETEGNALYEDANNLNRCVVLATGFFTTYLHEGKTYPYYVYQKNEEPFYMAGYYSKLDDGFITITLLLKKIEPQLEKILNISKYIPKILDTTAKKQWLSKHSTKKTLDLLINTPTPLRLNSHSIAKELFKMDISYDSMLEPVEYKGIPKFN